MCASLCIVGAFLPSAPGSGPITGTHPLLCGCAQASPGGGGEQTGPGAASRRSGGRPSAAPPRRGRGCPRCRPAAAAPRSSERRGLASQGGGWSPSSAAAANRAAPGEEPQRGKKKVRRKVRGSLGEDWPDQGPRAPLWPDSPKEVVPGDPAPIPTGSLHPLCFPKKVSLSLSLRARRNHLPTESQGGRTPENRLLQPSYFPEGQTEAQSEAATGIDHTAS